MYVKTRSHILCRYPDLFSQRENECVCFYILINHQYSNLDKTISFLTQFLVHVYDRNAKNSLSVCTRSTDEGLYHVVLEAKTHDMQQIFQKAECDS